MTRTLPSVTVSDKGERKIKSSHPWVFGDEVTPRGEILPEDGGLCDVYSGKDRYLGTGFFNSHSKIRVRLFSDNANDTFDDAFFRRRIAHAVDYRITVMGTDFDACRLIFGEADRFPGWTVDRFGDILVSEVLSLGIEVRRETLYSLLIDVLAERGVQISGIYERCDGALRTLEGMDRHCGYWRAESYPGHANGTVDIRENGVLYTVDYINGQKTGFFLDQKYNRRAAARLANGRHVLDCFTHTGSFGLNCALAGAAEVVSVDISEEAVGMARYNAERNGVAARMRVECADVFALLRSLAESKANRGRYDYIILDPPAFTKSRDTVKNAYRGYKEINTLAMRLLPRGGYLATCSCSHFMPPDQFKRMLHEAADDAHVALRQIEERAQAPDHPILWNVPETEYLKFYLFQIS